MTKSERVELTQLIRKRERVMRSDAEERAASLVADFERQIAEIYKWDDDEVWKQATLEAEKIVALSNEKIAKRCKQLGIPPEFAPSLSFGWQGRGQNAVKWRQAELRRVAKSQIEALHRDACAKIQRLSLVAQTEVVSNGLESESAREFLNKMPSLQVLMPSIDAKEVKLLVDQKKKNDWL